jgi:cytochrome P450
LLFGLQANAIPTSFWLLYHILTDPANEKKIREEIAPAFDDEDNLVNLDYLVQKTPLFNSMFWEALRWTSGAVSARKVEEDTMIGGTLFYTGGMVMMPTRINNTSPQLFGDDADIFVPDRFLRNPASIKSVRPFGGGHTLCPGRHFATNEILSFVATILRKYDISVLSGQAAPQLLTSVSNVGSYHPDREIQAAVKLRC